MSNLTNMDEKSATIVDIPLLEKAPQRGVRKLSNKITVLLISSLSLATLFWQIQSLHPSIRITSAHSTVGFDGKCPAQHVFSPETRPDITERNINQLFKTRKFWDSSAKRLSGAVQVPTMTFDDMDPLGVDPRWDIFKDLHKYLEGEFSEV